MSIGIQSNDLQAILKKSYDKKPSDHGDYKVDHSLSGQRAQVYKNDKTGKVIVAHRGTQGAQDVFTDISYGVGITNNSRFEHAKKIQKQAEAKYGKEAIVTVGHSLGGLIANDVTDKASKQITYNKPTVFNSKNKNELAIKTSNDPFSLNTNNENKRKVVIDNGGMSLNARANHSVDHIEKMGNVFL
jgi:putative lipase involved disintegration of autophagic bodies